MSKKRNPTDKVADVEPLLFDPAEATPFRDDIFNDSPGKDPEIDLLMVKAIKRSSDNAEVNEDEELAIKHGEMILQSHRQELVELENIDEGSISNKKFAAVVIILLFFVAFIIIMLLFSKLLGNAPVTNQMSINQTGMNNPYK